MNLVDSSGWLEYFADGLNATFFASAILDTEQLVVPTLSLLEVFKRVLQQRGEGDALQAVAVALMRQGQVVELDSVLALSAARLGVEHRLALADSVIYATARRFGALLWTQDADFEGLPGVRFVAKYRGPGG
ncbi:MAG: type II toxin-antitoxin system VapC family toxin [Candidatus Macondimonas sp.]